MPSDSTLTLFIPDLFGFQSTFSKLSRDELTQLPEIRFPNLEKWLSRGTKTKLTENNDVLFSEFGLSIEKDKPFAALSLLAENTDLKKSDLYWLRADPVNMQADRDTVLLAAHEELALSQDEANKLVETINNHFIDEPWTLYTFGPHRWYLGLEKSIDLITHPLNNVLGQNVNHFMSTGEDEKYWLAITNEIQMLLHGSIVNFERDSRNMLMANSVWLWGGGYLPDNINIKSNYERIISNNIICSGIGHYCELDVLPLDENFLTHIESGKSFVALDMLSESVQNRDLYTFMQKLNEIETIFLSQCNELLLDKKIDKLKLIVDSKTIITVTKNQLRHWWKRIKPFTAFKNA